MATQKPETLLVKKIMTYLDTVPKCCYEKRHGSMYSGVGKADMCVCVNGRHIEIEVKVPSAAAIKRAAGLVHMPIWPVYAMEIITDTVYGNFPGNPPTDLQVQRLLNWEAAGAVAFVAYSVDAVREVIEKLGRGEIK